MNSKEVLVLQEAEEDMRSGRAFYNKVEYRIGDYFWDSLLADIESLVLYSGIHAKQFDLYRMLAKRFPYAIYYFTKKDVAYVVAVLPIRRDPDWIRSAVRGRKI